MFIGGLLTSSGFGGGARACMLRSSGSDEPMTTAQSTASKGMSLLGRIVNESHILGAIGSTVESILLQQCRFLMKSRYRSD